MSRPGWSPSPTTRPLTRYAAPPGSRCRFLSCPRTPARTNLWTALRALPLKQRQTVAYHHLAGLPYAEIADLIGGTPAAARRAAADGIAALRKSRASLQPNGEPR